SQRRHTFLGSPGENQCCALLPVRVSQVRTDGQRALGLGQTAFIITLPVEGIREARSGLRVGAIERDSPARQCLRRLQGFREISPSKIRRLCLSLGQTFVATSKARIESDGLLKAVLCESTVLRVGFPCMPQTTLIRHPGIEASRRLAHCAVQFGLGDGRGHSKGYGLSNLVLHCKNIEKIAIIPL